MAITWGMGSGAITKRIRCYIEHAHHDRLRQIQDAMTTNKFHSCFIQEHCCPITIIAMRDKSLILWFSRIFGVYKKTTPFENRSYLLLPQAEGVNWTVVIHYKYPVNRSFHCTKNGGANVRRFY